MLSFDEAWALADAIPGWLTRDQGQALWNAARRLPPGARIVEIGSHQGRSTVVLAAAVRDTGTKIVAIDPFVEGRLFGGVKTQAKFEANLTRAGLRDIVELAVDYSTRLRPSWHDPIDLLYIDGKHDYWTFTDDLRWSQHLTPGADIFVHDSFSSFGVTSGLLARVLPSRQYVYLDRTGSLARLRRGRPTARDRARIARELPWFARNLGIKVLLRLRLRPVARLFGHTSVYDPY